MSDNPVILVVDGDELAYVIAAACEKTSICVTNNKSQQSSSFKTRTELKKFTEGLEVPEDFFSVKDVQEADEIENALHTIKVRLANYKDACGADEIEVYLSGKDNFRDSILLPTQYKSSRKDKLRPLLLKDIRNYLQNRYSAKIIDGQEVDDKVCARMWDGYKSQQKIVGVTQDKDAMGCSGWLYNPEKMEEAEFITGLGSLWLDSKNKVRGNGRIWMYCQWLMGDPTDDYNPSEICKARFGEKSAYKLLEGFTTDKECIQAVYEQYKKWYPAEVVYKAWTGDEITTNVFGIMQMYLDCARMRRWDNDTIDVIELLTKMEVAL